MSGALTKSWTFICGSKRDQEEGVSWTLTKSWTIICGFSRDQELGSELDTHEKVDNHLRVQSRSRGGR